MALAQPKPDGSVSALAFDLPEGMKSAPSKSRRAAVKMALSSESNKIEQRREFSESLVRESKALGAYIINKRLTKRAG